MFLTFFGGGSVKGRLGGFIWGNCWGFCVGTWFVGGFWEGVLVSGGDVGGAAWVVHLCLFVGFGLMGV